MEGFLNANWFFGWLWRTSWQVAIVIVLVLLVQWLFAKHLSPRWRHALWFLVVIRLAVPGSIESPTSLFNFFQHRSAATVASSRPVEAAAAAVSEPVSVPSSGASVSTVAHLRFGAVLRWIWLAGAAVLSVYLLVSTWQLGRTIRRQRPVINEAVLNLLEDCKEQMGVMTPLTLLETASITSPALLGFVRPRLLLPEGLIQSFSLAELRFVFLHELGHLKRGDILLNWLMTLPLVLHWFNPLVWYAVKRIRMDEESACDAVALAHAREGENQLYGQTIIKLLERFSCPAITPGLVGVLENKNQMKWRIGMIAKFKKTQKWPVVAASLFATLALVTLTDAQSQPQPAAAAPKQASEANPQGPPKIIATSPRLGDTDVDPATTEITVTFDRDMSGGMSWTGGGPEFPAGRQGQNCHWRDRRTCVFPTTLEAGKYYRLGINSKSHQNFRSASGQPARPSVIRFTTQGASDALKAKAAKPVIVSLNPANGAANVNSSLKEIRVTFNVPMGGGCSWCGDGDDFPTIPSGAEIRWTDGQKTCVLPVELKPGHKYNLGLNSESAINFQTASGVPLEPVAYSFTTKP